MKLKIVLLFLITLSLRSSFAITPDEGLWLPFFQRNFNYDKMRMMGLRLTKDQLYSTETPSIKDAIVMLGDNKGSGAIISKEGLLLTSYTNAYNFIIHHSSADQNYLKDGFWAKEKESELPCPGLTATFIVSVENVTPEILNKIPSNATPLMREKWIENNIQLLKEKRERDGKYNISIKPFFNGIEYYLFAYQTYKDVRLVGVPPQNIAQFGGDQDSWSWAQYAADFSLFRIYMAPDSTIAEYDSLNVPIESKYVLPLNIQGLMEDDFTFYLGFPTTTQRYKTSFEINNLIHKINPAYYNALDIILPPIRRAIFKDENIRLGYGSTYIQFANYNKHIKGENSILNDINVLQNKQNLEKIISQWLSTDSALNTKYGQMFANIDSICKKLDGDLVNCYWFGNISLLTSKTMMLPYHLQECRPHKGKRKYNSSEIEQLLEKYRQFTHHLNADLEVKIITSHFELWKKLPEDLRPQIYQYITKYYAGDVAAFAKAVVNQSIFSTEKNFQKFLKRNSSLDFSEDPLVRYFYAIVNTIKLGEKPLEQYTQQLIEPQKLYHSALKELSNSYKFELYPEANGTLRYNYGKVCGYEPKDAIRYSYISSHKGILEKTKIDDPEFHIPDRLKEMFEHKDFGNYDIDGFLPICFITNNDYSVGCSGSAILNKNGEIIGCAFDGNREALGNNIAYNTLLQRTVCVDMRYVLFLIDKYAEAGYLLKEMTIIN